MKNKITMLFLILGAMTFFFTCQKDDNTPETAETEVAAPQGPFKISTIDRSMVQNNSKLTTRLADLRNKHSKGTSGTQSREIYNEAYDFIIDTDNVTYIESTDGTYHSYTFEVFRSGATVSLENLLLSLQEDGSYKAVLVSYDLTSQEKADLLIGISPDYEGKISSTVLDDFDTDGIFSRVSSTCLTIGHGCCTQGNHPQGLNPDGTPCPANSTCYEMFCTNSGGPTAPGNTGDPNNGDNNAGIGTGGNTGNPDVTGITYSPQPWEGIVECMPNLLEVDNAQLLLWLMDHKTLAGQIQTYLLTQNVCSTEAQSDIIEIINSNIIESQITGDNLDHCSKTILDQLKELTQNDISNIINKFGKINSLYEWDIKTGLPPINSSNAAETDWKRDATGNAIDYNYQTYINPNFKNQATKIAIARTILHEMIHAYLISLVDDTIIAGSTEVTDYLLLWNALVNGTYDNNPNQLQHETIGRKFIEPLRDALKEWDGAIQLDQYYEDLAWGGLKNTSTFNVLFPIGSSQRDRILNTNKAEDFNITISSITPHGSPCQ